MSPAPGSGHAEYPEPEPPDDEIAAAPPSDRTRVRRLPKRGHYDRATIDAILDDAFVGHVAGGAMTGPPSMPSSMPA